MQNILALSITLFPSIISRLALTDQIDESIFLFLHYSIFCGENCIWSPFFFVCGFNLNSESNGILIHTHLVRKRTLNHLAQMSLASFEQGVP